MRYLGFIPDSVIIGHGTVTNRLIFLFYNFHTENECKLNSFEHI